MIKNLKDKVLKKKVFKRGFSLVELSIVLIVVGLVVVSVAGGNALIKSAKLAKARLLTTSSPVLGLESLVSWYEASLVDVDNFESDIDSSTLEVNRWSDINPLSPSTGRFDLVPSVINGADSKPIYVTNGINNLPSLEFGKDIGNGDNSTMEILNVDFLIGKHYTIFIVHKRTGATTANAEGPLYYFDENTDGLSIGYDSAAAENLRIRSGGISNSYAVASSLDKTIITSAGVGSAGTFIYENGVLKTTPDGAGETAKLIVDNIGSTVPKLNIGRGPSFFHGLISEVIIFDEELRDKDRKSIEEYLGDKYGVSIG